MSDFSKSNYTGTGDVSIPQPPDIVTILWQRNPLDLQAPRTIVEATIIGSARPCRRLLQTNYCRFGRQCYYNHRNLRQQSSTTSFPWYTVHLNDQQENVPRRLFFNSSRYRPY